MQVSLDAVNWKQLTRFGNAEDFFDWYYEHEDPDAEFEQARVIAWSDSARLYFHCAEVLKHLAGLVDPGEAERLNRGIRRLICENGQIDEFGTAEPTEHHYWISASPESTAEILGHLQGMDLEAYMIRLRAEPPPHAELEFHELPLEQWLPPFVEQHVETVKLARDRGFGLLGHCG